MTAKSTADDAETHAAPFDPALIAAEVQAALNSYLRERAHDQHLAFWKAVALGYGGVFEDLAGSALPASTVR